MKAKLRWEKANYKLWQRLLLTLLLFDSGCDEGWGLGNVCTFWGGSGVVHQNGSVWLFLLRSWFGMDGLVLESVRLLSVFLRDIGGHGADYV